MPGRSALGVVSKISEDGLKVHFYNDVKGLVTMAVLVKQGVVDATEAYRVGQVVRPIPLSNTPSHYLTLLNHPLNTLSQPIHSIKTIIPSA